MKIFNSEQVRKYKAFEGIISRGYYVDGEQLTDFYNEMFGTSLRVTNCGSCLRGRFEDLKREYKLFEKALKEQETKNNTPSDNKDEISPKKRVGRPKKKQEE